MIYALEFEVECDCGESHRYPLDADGRYDGPKACDPAEWVEVRIDPYYWRELMALRRKHQVH